MAICPGFSCAAKRTALYTTGVLRLGRSLAFLTILAISIGVVASAAGISAADKLPTRLSDHEFWDLVTEFSEPNGTFRSDNLLSNEVRFQFVIPELVQIAKPGGVYLGVGPEQNFTYIAAIKPALAFIVDIRRGNLDLHLVYKALFELSSDRQISSHVSFRGSGRLGLVRRRRPPRCFLHSCRRPRASSCTTRT